MRGAQCKRRKRKALHTDLVLDAARRAVEDALLDRIIFTLGPRAYRQFLRRLDGPPKPNDRLLRTMQTPHRGNERALSPARTTSLASTKAWDTNCFERSV